MKITRKQILEVCSKVDNQINYINKGGCGVFAFIMGSYLQQFENCKVRVKNRNLFGTAENVSNNVPADKSSIRNWSENGIDFYHIVLKIRMKGGKSLLIDSEGIYKDKKSLIDGSIPVEYLEKIVKNKQDWNIDFNRKDISRMIEIIDKYFTDILPTIKSINSKDWEGVELPTKSELPPSMPKSAVTKIKTYLDKRATGGMIIINLQDGYRFPDGDNLAYASSVKDAIAIMRKAA